MRVTLRALERKTERAFADDIETVEHRFHAELLRDNRAFLVDHAVAEEAGGDELGLRAVGQEVAGDLLDQELVVGQVAVQGLNHPITPGPLLAREVLFVTVAVSVAGRVQPVPRPFLTVVLALEQAVGECSDGARQILARRAGKVRHFRRRRRQADEIEVKPATQLLGRGGWRKLQPFLRQARGEERIHRRHSGLLADRRHGRLDRRLEGPVPGVRSALGDPAAEFFHIRGFHRMFLLRGRHHFVGVLGGETGDERACFRLAGHDGGVVRFSTFQRAVPHVQSEVALTLLLIRPVAGQAMIRQDGLDVAVEQNLPCRTGREQRGQAGKGRSKGGAKMAVRHARIRCAFIGSKPQVVVG